MNDEKQALQQQIRSAQNTLKYIEALGEANDAYGVNSTQEAWEKVEKALLSLQVAKWKQLLETEAVFARVSKTRTKDTIALYDAFLDNPEKVGFDVVQEAWYFAHQLELVVQWKEQLEERSAFPHINDMEIRDAIAKCDAYLRDPGKINYYTAHGAWRDVTETQNEIEQRIERTWNERRERLKKRGPRDWAITLPFDVSAEAVDALPRKLKDIGTAIEQQTIYRIYVQLNLMPPTATMNDAIADAFAEFAKDDEEIYTVLVGYGLLPILIMVGWRLATNHFPHKLKKRDALALRGIMTIAARLREYDPEVLEFYAWAKEYVDNLHKEDVGNDDAGGED